ncbi:RidA family protein [Kordiimonas pumila]|uniref:RidA family protein n=1 Tax=Kordiimonas pumila TaxID=2161677 RepID=A0ABV7D991_9PROT|nr:RidA family protein [Kordiimonas pumila]
MLKSKYLRTVMVGGAAIITALTATIPSFAQPITHLNPSTLPDAAAAGYSQITVMEAGKLAFISGQVAWRANGEPVPDTLSGQTEVVVANAQAALKAIGASAKNIVMVRAYMTDLRPETIAEVMPHLNILFDGHLPSLTGVGVTALAAPDLMIELEMTVRLD